MASWDSEIDSGALEISCNMCDSKFTPTLKYRVIDDKVNFKKIFNVTCAYIVNFLDRVSKLIDLNMEHYPAVRAQMEKV
jgi:hypothetical protein